MKMIFFKMPPRARSSAALVQLDHVAIRIAHEDRLRSGSEAYGPAAQGEAGRLEPLLRGHDVGAQEGEVRDPGVFLGYVHEDVRLVQNEVQLHSRQVIEDGDGLGADRTGGLGEAEQGVEAHRALEVVHANADVGEARDGDGNGLRHCQSASGCPAHPGSPRRLTGQSQVEFFSMFTGIIAAVGKKSFSVDVSRETLRCTAGLDQAGEVNLEKALRVSDSLAGHLVLGHVDGVGKVVRFEAVGKSRLLRVRAPAALARYIARKGSIAVHGVSLTVNAVRGAEFEVNLIPHTLAATTLRFLRVGDRINLEVDPLARYAERLLRRN